MDAVRMRRIIDDEGAEAVIAAAHEYANEQGYRVSSPSSTRTAS